MNRKQAAKEAALEIAGVVAIILLGMVWLFFWMALGMWALGNGGQFVGLVVAWFSGFFVINHLNYREQS